MSYDFSGGGYFGGTFPTTAVPLFLACYSRHLTSAAGTGGVMLSLSSNSANQAGSLENSYSYTAPNYSFRARVTDGAFATSFASYSAANTLVDDIWIPTIAVANSNVLRSIYFDDAANEGTETTSRDLGSAIQYLRIGQKGNGTTPFPGKIAEVVIGYFVPSAQQLADFFSGIPATEIFSGSNWYYYPLNAESTTQADSSGNAGPTLTITGTVAYDADHPTITPSTRYIPDVSPLYYGTTLLASKTGIEYRVLSGHTGIGGDEIAAGTNMTTDASGIPVFPGTASMGALNDNVTLQIYWTEGSDPVVDRSLIVKTTLVAEA